MTEQTDLQTIEWVCVGDVLDAKGKKRQGWQTIAPQTEHPLERPFWFGSKRIRGAKPGAIYRWTQSEDGKFYTSGVHGPVYERMHKEKDLVARWQLEHQTNNRLKDAEARANKEMAADELSKMPLFKLKALYQKSNRRQRRAIVLVLMHYLEGDHR